MLTPTQFRGTDLRSLYWSFRDVTPEGRGDLMPKRSQRIVRGWRHTSIAADPQAVPSVSSE
jgi:hypothetical protein